MDFLSNPTTGPSVTFPGSGGGAGNSGVATIDFGAGNSDASVTVTGQGSIAATSAVNAFLIAKATADHAVDDHWVEEMDVVAGNIVAGVGFTIYAKSRNIPLRGLWSVGWRY